MQILCDLSELRREMWDFWNEQIPKIDIDIEYLLDYRRGYNQAMADVYKFLTKKYKEKV